MDAHLAFRGVGGPRLHLGVCGSVAAYRALDLVRQWQDAGVSVPWHPLTSDAHTGHSAFGVFSVHFSVQRHLSSCAAGFPFEAVLCLPLANTKPGYPGSPFGPTASPDTLCPAPGFSFVILPNI